MMAGAYDLSGRGEEMRKFFDHKNSEGYKITKKQEEAWKAMERGTFPSDHSFIAKEKDNIDILKNEHIKNLEYVIKLKNKKLRKIQELLESWIHQQGHNKCWYYPDIFKAICKVIGIEVNMEGNSLPPREEFECGCKKYQDEVYSSKTINEEDGA